MREAAALFEGYHDFRTFMGKTLDSDRFTRREIQSIKIIERRKQDIGVSTNFSWPTIAVSNDVPESHVIVDVYFKGKGFLYKQVRVYFVSCSLPFCYCFDLWNNNYYFIGKCKYDFLRTPLSEALVIHKQSIFCRMSNRLSFTFHSSFHFGVRRVHVFRSYL